MKTLVAYASKTGTTQKCAEILLKKLDNAVLCDLKKETPNLESFDTIVIGGCIRMSTLYPPVRKFIYSNVEALQNKKVAIFICSGRIYSEKEMKQFLPKPLAENNILISAFGGEYNLDAAHGMDRLVVKIANKAAKKGKTPVPHIQLENIDAFAREVSNMK